MRVKYTEVVENRVRLDHDDRQVNGQAVCLNRTPGRSRHLAPARSLEARNNGAYLADNDCLIPVASR